jgi:hypothetical protein
MMNPFVEVVVESTKSGGVLAQPFARAHGFDFLCGDEGSATICGFEQPFDHSNVTRP